MGRTPPPPPRLSNHLNSAVWIGIGQIVAILATLSTLAIAANSLSLVDYGTLALALTGALLLNQYVFTGIVAATNRFYPAYDNLNAFWADLARLTIIRLAFNLPVFAAASTAASLYFGISLHTTLSALALGISQGAYAILVNATNASQQRPLYGITLTLEGSIRLALVYSLTRLAQPSPIHIIYAMIAAQCVTVAANIAFNAFFRNPIPLLAQRAGYRPHTASTNLTALRNYSRPYMYWGLFSWIHLSSDRWLLALYQDPKAVGEYAILFQLAYSPPTIALAGAMTLLSPGIFSKAATGKLTDIQGADRTVWGVIFAACAIAAALAAPLALTQSQLLATLTSKQLENADLLFLFFLAGTLSALTQPFSTLVANRASSRVLTTPKLICAVMGTALNYLALRHGLGLPGLLAALTATSLAFIAAILFWYAKVTRA